MINDTWAELSNNLVVAAMVVYAFAMVAFFAESAFGARARPSGAARRELVPAGAGGTLVDEPPPAAPDPHGDSSGRWERVGRIAFTLTVLATALLFGAVAARGLSAGRAPWANMYEFSIAAALVASVAYLVLQRLFDIRFVGVLVVPVVLLTLGLAVTVLYTDSAEVIPILDSYWLVIHVAAATICAGALTVGAALLVLHLVRSRAERRSGGTLERRGVDRGTREATSATEELLHGWLGRLPDAVRLERLGYRIHAFVFPLWTFAVVAGAIWAESAWGRYWGWDPKETWAFITWVVYAAYLHARATAGWRGSKASYIALAGYACLIFNLVGVNIWFVGLHSYAK